MHRNLQKRCDRILNIHRNLLRRFSPFFLLRCFSADLPDFYLGIWDLLSARARRLGRGAWFVGCSWHTVPSWFAANEVQDMLRLRARAAARPVQGMRRQQQLLRAPAVQRYYCNCKECGGSSFSEHRRQRSQCKECGRSSFCEHGRPRDYCNCRVRWQQHLRARAAVHHLHEGVQWQCHSQAQAAAWPLRAQATVQARQRSWCRRRGRGGARGGAAGGFGG